MAGLPFISGGGLIALSVWQADMPAVAPLLVVFGAAMIILGAFYARIEGNVEASRGGVKAVVREVERVASDQDLAVDEFADLLTLAFDRYLPTARKETNDRVYLQAAKRAADEAASDPENSPRAIEQRMTDAAGRWLRSRGWTLDDLTGRRDFGYDLRAKRNDDELLIELKSSRGPLGRSMIGHVASRQRLTASERGARIALVLSASSPGPTPGGLDLARQLGLEIYRLRDDGTEPEVLTGPGI